MENTTSARSWFCVWNNPQEILTGDSAQIAENALDMWVTGYPTRVGAVAYCISADGLIHLHMVLEDSNKARFSAVKKAYPKAHIEPTQGNREQAEDYIQKRGKFSEKGEQVIYIARFGEIKGRQGQRKDFDIISDYIEQGLTPNQILNMNFGYRRYEKMIRSAFFEKRKNDTPFIRDVKVYWHVGLSGSGKTYTAQLLMEQRGRDEVYLVTDYDSGGFDNYCAQKVLFLEEYRGQFRYSMLLNLIDKYMYEFHSRYTNIVGLWTEVHITSIMPPEEVYRNMVTDTNTRQLDPIEQLKRRITTIVYHYKDGDKYKTYEMPMTEYIDMNDLREKATGQEFIPVTEADYEQYDFLNGEWGNKNADNVKGISKEKTSGEFK